VRGPIVEISVQSQFMLASVRRWTMRPPGTLGSSLSCTSPGVYVAHGGLSSHTWPMSATLA
jgi:hypothetical protein